MPNECDFCDEFSGGNNNSFARIYRNNPASRILFRSPDFVVLPSLGQIIEGYLMIVPLRHFTAMADMPQPLVWELSELSREIRSRLAKTYGPCLFFEHGVRKQRGGCGIDHAHLHVVPFANPTEPLEELKQRHLFKPIGGIGEINYEVPQSSPYLYYEQVNRQSWVCGVDFIPSQYVRKLLAELMGINRWDWSECGREQSLVTALARLSRTFGVQFSLDRVDSVTALGERLPFTCISSLDA